MSKIVFIRSRFATSNSLPHSSARTFISRTCGAVNNFNPSFRLSKPLNNIWRLLSYPIIFSKSAIPSLYPTLGTWVPVNTIPTIAIITALPPSSNGRIRWGTTPYSTTKLTVFMTKVLCSCLRQHKLQIIVNRLWFRVQLGSVWTGGSTGVPKWGTEVRYQIERWSAGHLDRPHGQQNVW